MCPSTASALSTPRPRAPLINTRTLYVLPIGGGAPYKLTFGSYDDFHPRWSPDGEWIAYISNEGGLPQLCLLETYGGARKKIVIRERRWKRPMGRIHVRVTDEKTGKLTASRVQYLASDGKFYAPADAYSRIGAANRHFFHTEGEFTADVPPGRMPIEAVKGFDYQPAEARVEVGAGQTSDISLFMRRAVDMNALGWYSGSTHVHMNYGGNLLNTLDNLRMMSRAEDQDVLNVLVANKDNRILDWQYFVPGGGEHPVSKNDPRLKVIVGEEYRPPFYGHVFLLGLKDHLISSVHHRLRRNGNRKPVSQQHRYVPQSGGTGRRHRVRPRLRWRKGPAGWRSRSGQGISRGCSAWYR